MAQILYDVELWLEYAKQMRTLSKTIGDPRMRQQTLAAAVGFDRIAYLASKLDSKGERRPKTRRWRWAA